jgi:hypothetical protein
VSHGSPECSVTNTKHAPPQPLKWIKVVHVIPVVNKRFSACVSSSQARATLQSNVGRERKGSTFTRKQPTHTRAARTHTTAWLSVRIDVCVFMPFGPKVSYGCVHQRRRCGAHAALLLHPPSLHHTHTLIHSQLSAMVGPQGDRCAKRGSRWDCS